MTPSRLLEEVVVSATRTEMRASETGSTITVVNALELEQQQVVRVFDVLSQVPGLSTGGSESVAPRVNIRGAPFEHTLVLVDGIRMTMPSFRRSEIINSITPDNIERIEVLRGPQSTLYGGDAAAGVINIITKRGRGAPSGGISAEYGSWNSRELTANARGSEGSVDYSVEGGVFSSDWFSVGARDGERDARRHKTVSTRLGYEPVESWRLEGILRWVDTYREDDNFGIDAARYVDEVDYASRFQAIHDPANGRWQSIVGVSRSGNTNRFYEDGLATNPKLHQHITQLDYQGNISISPDHTLTLGTEYNEQQVSGGIFTAIQPDDITNGAAFVQWQGSRGDFFYTLGGRHDDNSDFGGFSTYKVSGSYALSDSTRLKGNVGSGFRTPSVAQLMGTSSCPNGNSGLQPEENVAAEIGLERQFFGERWGDARVEVNYFRNRITNVIVGGACEGSPPLENKDRRNSQGAELALRWFPSDALTLNANFSYVDAEDLSAGATMRAFGIPSTTANLGLRYEFSTGFSFNVNATYNGNRVDPPEVLASFVLVNLAAEYPLPSDWVLFGRVNNLLDEEYQTTRRAQTAERNMHIGVRRTF